MLLSLLGLSAQQAAEYTDYKVWPETTDSARQKVELRAYLPAADAADGRAVLILPGGGYSHLAVNHEGYDWAPFFNGQGIATFVLQYRMPKGNYEWPREDVNQAMNLIRQHAEEWRIKPSQIGIMGSSAGGHLAASTATLNEDSQKPAFQILFYPVISMKTGVTHQGSRNSLLGKSPSDELVHRYSCELQVTPSTPRAFLILSDDDTAVPSQNSILYYQALRQAGVSSSLHIYPTGGHGWGIRDNFEYHQQVMMELSRWLGTKE